MTKYSTMLDNVAFYNKGGLGMAVHNGMQKIQSLSQPVLAESTFTTELTAMERAGHEGNAGQGMDNRGLD